MTAQFVADDFQLRVGATTLSASGGLGAQRGGRDGLRATLTGSLVDLMPMVRLVPGLEKLDASGALDVEMRVTGTIDAPEIDGAFSLASGSFAIGALPPVHDVALRASYARGLLDLQRHARAVAGRADRCLGTDAGDPARRSTSRGVPEDAAAP